MVTNDVVFDESKFPLQDSSLDDPSEQSAFTNVSWDELWDVPSATRSTSDPRPDSPPPQPRPRRAAQPVNQFRNLIAYHAGTQSVSSDNMSTDDGPDHDNPTYSQAMKGPNRECLLQAMTREFTSLQAHDVGTLVEPPPDANILPGMWRLIRKFDKFNHIPTYKACWVAGGNHHIQGVDFESTYASVGLTDTLPTLYALAASDDLEMQSFDIETTFLNRTMKHDVYVRQVTGFRDSSRPTSVWRLNKYLYGTFQAHHEFKHDLEEKLCSVGFTISLVDNSLYTLRTGSSFIHLTMHVDDGMTFSNSISPLSEFKLNLQRLYRLK